MPYLIDGHNLIQSLNRISIQDPNDEAKLVGVLRGFMIGQGKKCIVFFDRGLLGGASRLSCSRVQVIFANTGQEADTRIINQIRNLTNPTTWTLVSSDSKIRKFASTRNLNLLHSSEFAKQLETQKAQQVKKEDMDTPISAAELQEWYEIFSADD